MELAITKYLKAHGLEKTIADFKLKHKEYPHKVLIKYDSIESNFTNEEVRDARGLVVEKGTWKVMSLAFRKFFNYGEGHAAPIDWKNARIFKKLDGSMIHVYFDYVERDIKFGTTGTADGEGDVDNFHYTALGGTFSDLFVHAYMETIKRNSALSFGEGLEADVRRSLVKAFFVPYAGYTLAFELCTPYNIVVTPHDKCEVFLLGARNLSTMEEVTFEELEKIAKSLYVRVAPTVLIGSSPENLKDTFEGMPYAEEGYVVASYRTEGLSENFVIDRLKMKNPAYCAIHFFKDSTAFWRLIDIVRSGDDTINEYKATFPGRGDEIEHLRKEWKRQIDGLDSFTKLISTFEEFEEYRKHKSSVLIQDKNINEIYKETFVANGITLVKNASLLSIEELGKIIQGLSEKELKDIKGILASDRGDSKAEGLRKNIAGRIMKWANENNLKQHIGFFFSYLNDDTSAKRYLMDYDGKELYNELIKGFNLVETT